MATQRGILLVNLGSPDSYSIPDVRDYLYDFLMDSRVLDIPYPLRWFVVRCCILPFRPKSSAHAYQSIWWPEGSPLIVISRRVQEKVQQRLNEPVELGMRYGRPSIEDAVLNLMKRSKEKISKILLAPLYPHYAMATYETVVVETKRVLKKLDLHVDLSILPPFYDHPLYLQALVESARPYLEQPYDHLLFSYHGLPVRQLKKTDPTGRHCMRRPDCCEVASPAHSVCYRHQVFQTTRLFARALNIPEEKYSIAFQSRLGIDKWVQPFTNEVLQQLPQQGVKRLLVICPAFVADCLETLEEIGIRGRETFLQAGGESFTLIPCLNDHPLWIDALVHWCMQEPEKTTAAIPV